MADDNGGFLARQRQIDEDHTTLHQVKDTVNRSEGKLDALLEDKRAVQTWMGEIEERIIKVETTMMKKLTIGEYAGVAIVLTFIFTVLAYFLPRAH